MADVPLSVLILAGGASTRMGADKAWLLLDGRPLVEWLARRLAPLAGEILISARDPDPFRALLATLDALPVPARVVADRYPGAGPLAGLQAGLSLAANDLLAAFGVDMPLVNPKLVRYMAGLAEGYDAVVPWLPAGRAEGAGKAGAGRAGGGETFAPPAGGPLEREPLHGVYRRTCLPVVEDALRAGRRRMTSFLAGVRVRDVWPAEIARFDPDYLSFANANTPAEWERIQRLWSAGG